MRLNLSEIVRIILGLASTDRNVLLNGKWWWWWTFREFKNKWLLNSYFTVITTANLSHKKQLSIQIYSSNHQLTPQDLVCAIATIYSRIRLYQFHSTTNLLSLMPFNVSIQSFQILMNRKIFIPWISKMNYLIVYNYHQLLQRIMRLCKHYYHFCHSYSILRFNFDLKHRFSCFKWIPMSKLSLI